MPVECVGTLVAICGGVGDSVPHEESAPDRERRIYSPDVIHAEMTWWGNAFPYCIHRRWSMVHDEMEWN